MRQILLLAFWLFLIACSSKQKSTNDILASKVQDTVMWSIVHYAAKLAPAATHETKFNHEFDDYYKSVQADYKFLHLTFKNDETYYFLISRPARSITPMSEGIGGYFQFKNDTLIEYDEIFRTWKMPDTELAVRGKALFERMVSGADLSIYYTRYSGDKYIEFPDDRFYFDKQNRIWKDGSLDSIQ